VPPATGEPTPLWHLPLVVAALAAPLLLAGAADAALRVAGGSALVGAAQAVLLARIVADHERRAGRVFVRLPGSRILRGTRLGWAPAPAPTAPAPAAPAAPSPTAPAPPPAARTPAPLAAPSPRRPPGAFHDEPA
jgi:pyruvate/2-oxoglutarate dehydrogenase complex dihydrolipoamide acyltransferase (E2) component